MLGKTLDPRYEGTYRVIQLKGNQAGDRTYWNTDTYKMGSCHTSETIVAYR